MVLTFDSKVLTIYTKILKCKNIGNCSQSSLILIDFLDFHKKKSFEFDSSMFAKVSEAIKGRTQQFHRNLSLNLIAVICVQNLLLDYHSLVGAGSYCSKF